MRETTKYDPYSFTIRKCGALVLVCPICLGVRIDLYLGGYGGKIYKCLDCGYVGPIILEVDEKDLVEILMRKELEDAKSGKPT